MLFQCESGVNDEGKRDISKKILSEFDKWMERFDCLVVGPGLGRDPFLLVCFSQFLLKIHAFAFCISKYFEYFFNLICSCVRGMCMLDGSFSVFP